MLYKEIDIEEELPPNTNEYFIIKFNGRGSWYEDEVDTFTGKSINGDYKEIIKVWLKPINDENYER